MGLGFGIRVYQDFIDILGVLWRILLGFRVLGLTVQVVVYVLGCPDSGFSGRSTNSNWMLWVGVWRSAEKEP